MAVDTSELTHEEVDKWFLENPKVDAQTFEIALVLGGTVSAGAYTAGVLDYLVEALDAWTERRAEDQNVPQHKVLLRVVAGTSGGGVNAAILARALNYQFPRISWADTASRTTAGNPLYDTWVNILRLGRFLETNDLKEGLVSILNGSCIDEAAAKIARFTGIAPKARAWIGAPLRVILTLTNLRGIPYKVMFGNEFGETFVDHADHMRFALCYPGQAVTEFRPDELVLDFESPSVSRTTDWRNFGEFACATAAFPIGFPPRVLTRPTAHYRYRVVPRRLDKNQSPGDQKPYDVLSPHWEALKDEKTDTIPENYEFLAVDGGATNNEPIELARTGLCGLLGSNPRAPDLANRGLVLVDPFAGEVTLGPKRIGGFAHTAGGVIGSLIEQTRYDSRDLMLAADDNIYSRFMITPRKGGLTGAKAIASAGLGAFIGFACQEFMRHDYLLGRRNCQAFLQKDFVLAENNKVFGGVWPAGMKAKFAGKAGEGMQPIIPLMSDLEQLEPDWPTGRLNPETYRDAIEQRFRSIAELEVSGSPWRSVLGLLGGLTLKGPAADFIIEMMYDYLEEAKLTRQIGRSHD